MFTTTRRSNVTTVCAAITDPALRLDSKSYTADSGQPFRPTRVTLTRTTPARRSVPEVQVHVSGPQILRSGGLGMQVLSVDFVSGPLAPGPAQPLQAMPKWLAGWVNEATATS